MKPRNPSKHAILSVDSQNPVDDATLFARCTTEEKRIVQAAAAFSEEKGLGNYIRTVMVSDAKRILALKVSTSLSGEQP